MGSGRIGRGEIFELLRAKNLTLDELAYQASNDHYTFSKSTLSRIFSRQYIASLECRKAIANALEISMHEFERYLQMNSRSM